jgi:hypothetical protein
MEAPTAYVALEDITQLNNDCRIVIRGGRSSAFNTYKVYTSDQSGAPVLTGVTPMNSTLNT